MIGGYAFNINTRVLCNCYSFINIGAQSNGNNHGMLQDCVNLTFWSFCSPLPLYSIDTFQEICSLGQLLYMTIKTFSPYPVLLV